ncbi:hypothetical protein VTI28DRAFT_5584 [Corynascus sepedonium]
MALRLVAFSHDSQQSMSGSDDEVVKILDAVSGSCLQTINMGTSIHSYRGHFVHFLRDVGKTYSELPLPPKDLDLVILHPRRSEGVEQIYQQSATASDVCQLPEDGNVFDQLNIHDVTESENLAAELGPTEEPGEGCVVVGEAAVPNMLIHDSKLNQLQGQVNDAAVEHEPSALETGRKSGRFPLKQHTCCFGFRVEQKLALGLYLVKSAPEMPHLLASSAQPSPAATCTVLHSAA